MCPAPISPIVFTVAMNHLAQCAIMWTGMRLDVYVNYRGVCEEAFHFYEQHPRGGRADLHEDGTGYS